MGKGGGMHKPMGWGNGRHGRECKGEWGASGRIARGEKEGECVPRIMLIAERDPACGSH